MNESLETLLADGIIEAVIGQLKTGKEAEVWLVQHAGEVVAAKLYKERHERNFRNNVGYREGREVRNSRTRRAMEKGSRFGQAATEDAWKSAESDSLYKLHAQGVRVPTPVLFYEGILLMELVLDAEGRPAPRLVEAPPATPEDAQALYLDLRSQVVNMLCADLIHGDLSPYNILMSWQGATIIDFPQTVAAARNNRAEFYFRRDLDNVRDFLAGIAPWLGGMAGDTGEIWNAYVRRELTPDFAPSGSFREGPRRGGNRGPRDSRAGGEERRRDFRPEPAAPEVAPPPRTDMSPEEAAEAELRELEALVLKQGGGERGKPAVAPPQRGGRKRSFGGGRPPPRTGGNRPPAMGGAPRPPQGEQRGGNAPRPPQGEQRAGNGARPPQGEQRTGSGARPPPPNGQRMDGPRAGGNGRPAQGGPRGPGNPRPMRGEPRGAGNLAAPPSEPMVAVRDAGGTPHESRGPGARGNEPRGRNNQGSRPGEPRGGGNGRPPRNEQRGGNGGFEQRGRGEPRGGGNGHPGWSEQRGGEPSRPPRGERRGGGPVVETRPAMGAPLAGAPPEQRAGGPGNGGGPRQQRPGQNRGGSRPQRSGAPQVSFASRPAQSSDPGSHETGS
ncbi:MAG TPA: RIO1 family regulatory kinase/ATPase [Myxococcus sp.]|nr:RIO1 family regulatory kinase/ATPase [Myxococcus sp.]